MTKKKTSMSPEILEFLKNNVKGLTCKQLAELINSKFGSNYSWEQIKYYKIKNGLKSEIHVGFENNGVAPHNKKEIGYEFTTKNGYTFIKVDNTRHGYISKAKYMYEKYHNLKVPKNYRIVFLNQDKTDFSKENLAMVHRATLMTAKNRGLISGNRDVTKTGLMVANLINETYDKKMWLEKEELKELGVDYETL